MSMDMKGMKHSPKSHYQQAETLLHQGEDVIKRISELADERRAICAESGLGIDDPRLDLITMRMDELGKKAMGTWAQAQAHATLATVDAEA